MTRDDALPPRCGSDLSVPTGAELRDRGVSLVTTANPSLYRLLLDEAIRVSNTRGEAHADDVRAYAARECLVVPSKVLGAIWSHRSWRKIGERASTFPGCHAHRSGVYVWDPGWRRKSA